MLEVIIQIHNRTKFILDIEYENKLNFLNLTNIKEGGSLIILENLLKQTMSSFSIQSTTINIR